jgi:GntR family transcriptional regulator
MTSQAVPSPLAPRCSSSSPSTPASPLHVRIRSELRTGILDGRYPPMERMPSESELGARFGASRTTVRQAIGDLQREGLIFTRQGKGSFVSQPKAFQNVTHLTGLGESLSTLGYEVANLLKSVRYLRPDAAVAARLSLPATAEVCEIERVRLLNRAPISRETTYVPAPIGRQLERADLLTRDIFLVLENDCGIALGHADLRIDATLADEALASALRYEVGAPVLRIERLTHDAVGRPIDFEFLHYRADAFQYRLRTQRKTPA